MLETSWLMSPEQSPCMNTCCTRKHTPGKAEPLLSRNEAVWVRPVSGLVLSLNTSC